MTAKVMFLAKLFFQLPVCRIFLGPSHKHTLEEKHGRQKDTLTRLPLTWALSTPENNPDLKEHEIKELKAKAEKAKSGQKEDSKKQRMEAFAASKQEPKPRGRPSALRKSAASDHPANARCKSKTEKGGTLKRKVRCEKKESSENELDSEEALSDPEDSDGSKPAVPKAHATRKPKEIKDPVLTQKVKAGAALAVLALGHSVGKQQAADAKNGKEHEKKRDRGMAKKDEGLTEKKAKKDSGKEKKEHEEKLSKKEMKNAKTEPKETKSKSKEKKHEKNLNDTKEKKTRNNSQDPGNTEKKVKAADALKQMVSKKDNKVIDDKVSKRPKTESQSKRPRSGSLPKEHPDKQPRTKMALNRGRSSVALPSVASKVRSSSSSNSTGAHVQVEQEVVEAKVIANKTNANDKSVADGGSDSDATTVRLGQEPEHLDGDVEKDDDESNESQDENGDKKVESEEEKDGSEEEDQSEKEEEKKSEEAHCTRKIPTNFQALSQNICFLFGDVSL